jgi:hypothetical protein
MGARAKNQRGERNRESGRSEHLERLWHGNSEVARAVRKLTAAIPE